MTRLLMNILFVAFFLLIIGGGFGVVSAQIINPSVLEDPFYQQKGSFDIPRERTVSPFQHVEESVDPFTGNLNLLHTDLILPGNGGLDLKIHRSYNSRIWGRKDTSFPGLIASNERSVMSLGWSFHFGRVRNPGSDSPVIEMPDGSTHPMYQSSVAGQKISRERWIFRFNNNISKYELVLTDGTVYTFAPANQYGTADGVVIYQVDSITTPNGNTITLSYQTGDPRLITSILDSANRSITFNYTTITNGTCLVDHNHHKALTSIVANGKTYTYFYQLINCSLLLTEAKPPVGPSWKYTYHTTNPGLYELKTVTYPSGAVLTYG